MPWAAQRQRQTQDKTSPEPNTNFIIVRAVLGGGVYFSGLWALGSGLVVLVAGIFMAFFYLPGVFLFSFFRHSAR